jgi:hypothetical protein
VRQRCRADGAPIRTTIGRPKDDPRGSDDNAGVRIGEGDLIEGLCRSAGLGRPRGPPIRRLEDAAASTDDKAGIRVEKLDALDKVRCSGGLGRPRGTGLGNDTPKKLKEVPVGWMTQFWPASEVLMTWEPAETAVVASMTWTVE